MNKLVLRIISLSLFVLMIVSALGGCSKKSPPPSLEDKLPERVFDLSWKAAPSDVSVSLSAEWADTLRESISQIETVYPYAGLYETEEALSRLDFDASVESHEYCVLKDGALSAEVLAEAVKKNNEEFFADDPYGYEPVEDEYLAEICSLIVETVEAVLEKHPDIDRDRVYCTMGSLKIVYDITMLDFAQVTSERVLTVSNVTANMAELYKGEGAYRSTLIHETMHIIQIGCQCEDLGREAERRCGICVYWKDWDMNHADWGWFFEASAERNSSNLTNADPMTYTYWVDYLCSFNMAVILNELNGADRMESICFYSDPELLFSAFGCETEEERAELVNALISVNVLQTSPESFYKRYEEEYGERPDADEEKHEAFRYSLKPAVATTLMKTYYKNLVSLLERQELNINDLCFLINVFESQMNQHLSYDRDKAEEVNMPFYESCLALRGQLFDALESSNEGLDMESVWQEYDMSKMGEKTLNAALDFLPDDKKMFFLERCQWHADRVDLGVKLPNIAK